MGFQIKRKAGVIIAILLAVLLAAGCGRGIALVSDVSKTEAYSLPETMIVVATERNRYQQVYTSQIWDETLPDGRTFESYLLEQVQQFLQDVKMMNLLAQEKGISLTGAEKEDLEELSRQYYESLSKDDINYMNVTENDVRTMYEVYYMAEKVVVELTRDMNLEISDSEAKVIAVEQIVMSDENTAAAVLSKAQEEGADFAAIAREYTEAETVSVNLGRGEMPGAVEDGAFALAEGQVSDVISQDGFYYIFKCISDYDEDATQARKDNLYLERKKEAFGQIYSQWKTEHPITFDNGIWEKIAFSKEDKTTTTNFFDLYNQRFDSVR